MMNIDQAARMIEWLDEERRRDKATITTLEERLAQQQESIELLTRRLSGMESDQSVLRAQSGPTLQSAELLEQMRKEMQQMAEALDSKRLNAEREAERRSELNREQIMKSVRDLTEKATKIERQTTEIPVINVERDRVSSQLTNLQGQVEELGRKFSEPERRLLALEEQRRTDARRLTEIESEIPELRKAVDTLKPKMALLEDLSIRTERKVIEVQNGDRERREQMQQFIDQQTLLLQQRDGQVQDLVKRFAEQDTAMQAYITRFETWSETHRQMKKILEDFERIGERLERRMTEVAEMTRLSEERFRTEWNDWRGEDQKRWKQFTLSNDEIWRLHDKDFARYLEQLQKIYDQFPPIVEAVNRLWQLERERAQLYRDRYQSLLSEHDNGQILTLTLPSNNGSGLKSLE